MGFFQVSIATRLVAVGLAAVAIASLGGAIGGYGVWSNGKQFRAFEEMAGEALLASAIDSNMAKVLLNAREYLATRGDEDLKETRQFIAETKDGIAKGLKEFHAPDRVDLIKKISWTFSHFEVGFEHIVILLAERDRIVAEVLDKIGPQIRAGFTKIVDATTQYNDYRTAALAGVLQEDLITARLYIAKYLLNNKKDDALRAVAEFDEIDRQIDNLSAHLLSAPKGQNSAIVGLHEIRPLLAQYREGFKALRKVIDERNSFRATTLDGDGKSIGDWAAEIKASAVKSEHELAEHVIAKITRDEIAIIAMAVLAFVFAGVASYLNARSLSRPIMHLAAQMRALAAGDTNIRLDDAVRQDEIGEMTKAVVVFRDSALERDRLTEQRSAEIAARAARQNKLEELVRDFDVMSRTMLHSVGANSTQMQAMAQAMSDIANGTSNNIASAASGSDNASHSVEEMAVAATELSQSIEDIGAQVEKTAQIVSRAAASANAANEKVKNLADAASEIGDVVAVIREVAEQTNLLALNATIEAARAGAAGR